MNKRILSILLAVVCAGVAQAATRTWIGADGASWNTAANWDPATVPTANDTAIVGKAGSVKFGSAGNVGTLQVGADVVFFGNKTLKIKTAVEALDADSTLTLSNMTFQANGANGTEIPIKVALGIAKGTSNTLLCKSGGLNTGSSLRVDGPLFGSGTLVSRAADTTAARAGTIFNGDNSGFAGTIKFYPQSTQKADQPRIASAQASSAKAAWELNVEKASYTGLTPDTEFFGTPNETYRFGALKANFYFSGTASYWATAGVTLEVGGLDFDGYAKGKCAPGDGVIDWVGESATFTNEVLNLARLRLSGGGNLVIGAADGVPKAITFAKNGGVLSLASDVTTDLSSKFKDSTAPIVFDDRGVDHTWATGLDGSNVGGFVKRGAGTLVWTAAPASPIDVAVEQGTLVVPFGTKLGRVVIADGAVLKVDTTGHTAGIAFVAASSDRPFDDTRLVFDPKPAGLKAIPGVDNGVAYVLGSKGYTWRGPTDNANWSTAANWYPSGVPQEQDTVAFTNAPLAQTVIDQAAAALSVDATNGLALGGSFQLSVASYLKLLDDLTLTPNPMSGETGADAYAAANRLGVSATSLSARSVAGEGFVSAAGSDLVGLAEAGTTNGFVGTLTARNFTKTGAGVYTLIGEGAFSGTVAIEEGTLRLGTYRDLYNIRYDFDASDTASLTESDGAVSSWKSQVGDYVLNFDAGQMAGMTTAYFGGKPALRFRPDAEGAVYSRYALSPANAASGCASKSLFLIYQGVNFTAGTEDEYLYGETGAGGILFNESQHNIQWINAAQKLSIFGIFTGMDYASPEVRDEPKMTLWSDTVFQSSGNAETLGTQGGNVGFEGAVAEVVAFTNTLTQVEREVTTKSLMRKWGLGYADYRPLKPTASVTMKAGATLDLGGQTVEAAGFEGAGVVTNGVLETARVVQKGGDLSIPAVDGTTYVLSKVGEKLTIRDAAGKAVTIVVPHDWSQAGYSGVAAVLCRGEVTWDFSEWPVKPVPVYDGQGWWSIPAGGSALRLR